MPAVTTIAPRTARARRQQYKISTSLTLSDGLGVIGSWGRVYADAAVRDRRLVRPTEASKLGYTQR
jgi:hypothetical protein